MISLREKSYFEPGIRFKTSKNWRYFLMKRLFAAVLVSLCMCGFAMAQSCGAPAPAPACDSCGPVCYACGPKTICTPFNGFFLELFHPACPCDCAPAPCTTCGPCAPAPVCAPCAAAPACPAAVCDTCVGTTPCAIPVAPFNGFFRTLFAPKTSCDLPCDCAPAAPACGCGAPIAAPACGCGK